MFKKTPTMSSSSGLTRPATGVPITMSSPPVRRATRTSNAASSSMNGVTPVRPARARSASVTGTGSEPTTWPPSNVCRAGRPKSGGISQIGRWPPSCSRQ